MNARIGKRILARLLCAAVTAACLAPTPARAAEVVWPKRLVLSTATSGTALHSIATAIAKTIERNTPIQRVIVQPVGGPLVWAPMMQKGELDLAIHSGPDTLSVMRGEGAYRDQGPMPFIRTLVPGTEYSLLFYTTPRTGIKTLADLKGKTAYTALPGNPMFRPVMDAMFEAAGMTEQDLKESMTMPSQAQAVTDLIEGRVDAALFPAVPASVLEINQAAGECVFISPDDSQAAACLAKLPQGFFLRDIPADSEDLRNKREVPNAPSFRNVLYARADMDPEVAHAIVKAVLEHRDEWEGVSPLARSWGTIYAAAPPYHEGAERWYRETGQWNDEVDAAHRANLKMAEDLAAAR